MVGSHIPLQMPYFYLIVRAVLYYGQWCCLIQFVQIYCQFEIKELICKNWCQEASLIHNDLQALYIYC